MAQTIVNNVTLQLRQDTITNWESNQTKLKKGEPGLIYNDGGSSLLALVIGQNDSTEAITLYQEKLCFYPGKELVMSCLVHRKMCLVVLKLTLSTSI
jgi:hypothetical protein